MIYRMNKEQLLLIFIKNPVLGKVKTRLAKDIGMPKALEVYQYLLEHTRQITKGLTTDKAVFYSEYVDLADAWDNAYYQKFAQQGSGLGERMNNAFRLGFEQGYQSMVIIGSDCIEINQEIIEEAFNALKTNDFVIGPAKDGGYYLLGMNKLYTKVFVNKTWSTSGVFAATMQDFTDIGASVHLLPKLSDIDTVADLELLNLDILPIKKGE